MIASHLLNFISVAFLFCSHHCSSIDLTPHSLLSAFAAFLYLCGMPTKGKRICKHRKNTSITRRSPSYSPDDNASSSDSEKSRSPDEVNHKVYSREHSPPQEDYASDDYSSSDEEYKQKIQSRWMREHLNRWEQQRKRHPRKKRNRRNNPKRECSRMRRKPKDPGHLPKHTHHNENTKRGRNTQQNPNSGKATLTNHHLHQA